MILKINNIHKSFGSLKVLKGIDLEVNKGDVISVIGPSGCGKTTLLRCLNFLNKADEGTLIFDDIKYDLKNITKKEIANIRKKTGFVFQNFNLFLNKTALENVLEGLIIARKMDKDKATSTALKSLEKVGLLDKKDYYPSSLSGGQQQRVAIARALALDPEIIYFDEPTSALDPELVIEVLNVIKELAKEGMTMIIVTHEMSFAKSVSNKTIFIDEGKIIEENNSKELFENPKEARTKEFLRIIKERS